ncbi:CvfB family protein [Dethiothermospora halolimnae]|uniref:CvfB family protein n=1 Tax=Dethiothermospora halolimnae TaxID=3114390 RepID=UPI003CCBFA22
MIKLGKMQKLKVIKKASQGIYLNEEGNKKTGNILLPKKEVPSNIDIGDEIEVFIYKDSKDRIIATTKKPKLMVGDIGSLKVSDTTRIGAFLDWGLDKDLFLPFREQKGRIKPGRRCLVTLYVDKTSRLCATMDIYKHLTSDSPYKENDVVKGIIYGRNHDLGTFVAVDNKYHGLIPKWEVEDDLKIGDEVEGRVVKVRKDGKLNLSLTEKAYKIIDKDAKVILDNLVKNGGELPLNDNSSPDKIRKELRMSKSAFKRAVGRLLKRRVIEFTRKGIRLKK